MMMCMKLSGINAITLIVSTSIFAGSLHAASGLIPSEELALWQSKYPGNTIVSAAKTLQVNIDVINNILQTNVDYYRELIVLSDNSAYLADSKEYYNNHYTVKKLEAYSLVPEARQYRKLAVSKFTKTFEIDDYVFYDDQQVYNFTFPSVGKGTKLITKSSAVTSFAYIPIVFDFGTFVPGENMLVTLSCPQSVDIKSHLFGKDTSMVKFTKLLKGDRIVYTWEVAKSKAYVLDDNAPDSRYFLPHLVIQIASYVANGEKKKVLGTLDDLHAYNYSHIKNLSAEIAAEVQQLSDSLCKGYTTDRDKVKNIYRWVQKNIKYVAIEDGDNGVVPSEANQVLKKRYGDCKGKTSLLVAMLKSQNLKASFAWVGSRERPYRFSEFPSVICSDHMIAVWWDGEKPLILDGTTYNHRMGDIPAFIQGKECMIEKGPDEYSLITLNPVPPEFNTVMDSLNIQLLNNTVSGTGVITFMGENSARISNIFEGKDTSSYRNILRDYITKASNKHIIQSVGLSDPENQDRPFSAHYRFQIPDFVVRANGNMYVNMNIDRFLQNVIIDKERYCPVETDMTIEYRLFCRLMIPEGYRLKKLPDSINYKHPLFGFKEEYTTVPGAVILSSCITLNFLVIDGEEMAQFRDMLSLLNRNMLRSLSFEKTEIL
jgi:hypothetical protein